MSAETNSQKEKVTYDNILSFIRTHKDPVVTAGEVAAEFDISNQAANYRLSELSERGKVREKTVGASAKVWYHIG